MRISIKEALERGLITPRQAVEIRGDMSVQTARRAALTKPAGEPLAPDAASLECDHSPQKRIYDALNAKHPGIAMWEVGGLVPGRRFRADIYLPESRLVVEMDGYQFHKSKEQFQKDREKRALLVMRGYPVIGVYYAQVKKDLENLVNLLLDAHEFYKPFARQFFERDLELAISRDRDSRA